MNDTSGLVAQHWLISGHVQGVGYRMWLQREARALDVAGWVRNLGDGRVEAVLLGSVRALDSLAANARGGPPLAAVDDVEVLPWAGATPAGRFTQQATAEAPADG